MPSCATGKQRTWVVFDGGPMMSLLKLQRIHPDRYDKLHPIVGALHEEMCYLGALSTLLDSVGLSSHESELCQRHESAKHSQNSNGGDLPSASAYSVLAPIQPRRV